MLITLGLGSATALGNCVISVICDQWPNLSKVKVTLGYCTGGFILGLIYVTPVRNKITKVINLAFLFTSIFWQFKGGQAILQLVNTFGGGFVIFAICTLEVIGVSWLYGKCANIHIKA